MFKAAAVALCALVSVVLVYPALGADAIFPAPIHLTREIHDSISGKTVVLNEYGYGNRLVSVRGDRTAIADYEKGELTEIDRGAGTFSVTRFETVARAARLEGARGEAETDGAEQHRQQELRALGAKQTRSGRPADVFRTEGDSDAVEVALDQTIRVSEEALEVLLGSAYPGTRNRQFDLVLAAAGGGGRREARANAGPEAQTYALPLEQRFELKEDGERVEFRSAVLRVASEPPPAEVLAIPAGARMVDSRTTQLVRELERIDAPPLHPPNEH